MKISVIGAGNVGATCADILAQREVCAQVVLLDIKSGLAEGKALDINQKGPIIGYDTRVIGVTGDYSATKDSSVVVVTSGLPRKPGMSRDDLIETNAAIVDEVVRSVVQASPNSILIIVSNPLDVMTYQAHLSCGWPRERVIGMAGVLDTARYRAFLSDALGVSVKDIQALLMGGHGDTMVPLPRYTTVAGIPVQELIDKETLSGIIERTRKGGGELVNYMGTSAWMAPGAAAAQMAEAIVKDQKRVLPVCIQLKGEYGIQNGYIGVPVVLGLKGVHKLLSLELNETEQKDLQISHKHVAEVMRVLDALNEKKKGSKG